MMKVVMAMRTNACEASDGGGINEDDMMDLVDWC